MTTPVLRFERFDAGLLAKAKRLGNGAVRVAAHLARTGVQVYRNADGSERREYRPPSEVFDADALESLADVPVTIGHPGMVDTQSWRRDAIGHVSAGARRDGDFVAGNVVVHDDDAIRRIDEGELSEVSVGYLVEYDAAPGVTPSGEKYDGIQRRVRANHVALLPKGHARAGREARLRLDGNEEITMGDTTTTATTSDDARMDAETERLGAYITAKEAHAAFLTANAWRGDTQARQLLAARIDSGALPKLPPEPALTRTVQAPSAPAGPEPDELAAAERSRAASVAAGRPRP